MGEAFEGIAVGAENRTENLGMEILFPGIEATTPVVEVAVEEPDVELWRARVALALDAPDHSEAALVASESAPTSITGATLVVPIVPSPAYRSRIKEVVEPLAAKIRPMKMRRATRDDVPAMVDVDLKAFHSVYKDSPLSPEELRADLLTKFAGRYEKIGGKWIEMVFSRDDRPLGFIMGCPTSKPPEEFVSWEDTTDNGTLDSTYDPNGKHLYVVSLSTVPEASSNGAQDMLMVNMIGNIVGGGYEAYFESRLPGLKKWVLGQCRASGKRYGDLTKTECDNYAQTYFESKIVKDDKKVPLDPMMRMYEGMGCSFVKLAPDAYQDSLSMNYGVVCRLDNPLPPKLQHYRAAQKLAGLGFRAVSHVPLLIDKLP